LNLSKFFRTFSGLLVERLTNMTRLQMKRTFGARRALSRALLAVLGLLVFEVAAGLPGLSRSALVVLAIFGYVSFVLLARWALLPWRREWENLWRTNVDRRTVSPFASFSKPGYRKTAS
jgi:hypothetical protein